MNNNYCCQCGKPRRNLTEPLRDALFIDDLISTLQHRKQHPDLPAGTNEISPQMIAHWGVRRNGGTDEQMHICDGCLLLAVRAIHKSVSSVLAELDSVVNGAARSSKSS